MSDTQQSIESIPDKVLWQFRNLHIVSGGIKSHRELVEKASMIHCDIKPEHLFLQGNRVGFFDYGDAAFLGPNRQSGVYHKGTRPYKAIAVLLGEQNSVMGDLESFFWSLFFICVYGQGTGMDSFNLHYDRWWWLDADDLAQEKMALVRHEETFLQTVRRDFKPDYQYCISCINRLRAVMFPGGERRRRLDMQLYDDMIHCFDLEIQAMVRPYLGNHSGFNVDRLSSA